MRSSIRPRAARLTRRATLAALPLALAACTTRRFEEPVEPQRRHLDPRLVEMYGPIEDDRFPVPAIDIERVPPEFLRQNVPYNGPEAPGTIVVDPANRFLYLVREGGEAVRYGVGVGREGFNFSGRAIVGRKAEWPRWTPTVAMQKLYPKYREFAGGMPGGVTNPLGARALYLYRNNTDTLFRIHGTIEPDSIGRAVSSGCIRLFNQDIINLHSRVPTGTPVVVKAAGAFRPGDAGPDWQPTDPGAPIDGPDEVAQAPAPQRY